MDRTDRAKQFLPFDSLKGLKEALANQEELLLRTEKRERSEEDAEALSRTLSALQRGDRIRISWYKNGYYLETSGKIEEFNAVFRYLRVGEERIAFDDVYEVDRSFGGEGS